MLVGAPGHFFLQKGENRMPEQQEDRQPPHSHTQIENKKGTFMMKPIDKDVLKNYNAGMERNRLRTGIGVIEFARTKELLLERLPSPPAVIYDIGGGYGEYAWYLASLGYEVHLFDLAETNIRMSSELSSIYPGVTLASAEVADARSIHRPDHSADAVLLMGPLYHITDHDERLLALSECRRVLKHGGLLFTAGIMRYSTLLWAISVYGIKNRLLEEPEFMTMIARELMDGQHIKPEAGSYHGIGNSYFHNADEMRSELKAAGFLHAEIHGIDCGAWLAPKLDELWADEISRNALLHTVRLLDTCTDVLGLSTHILGIARNEN